MEPIAIILTALLSAYVPDGFSCSVVEATPAAIEVFCFNPQTDKLRFALIERAGRVVVVDGLAL